MQVEMAVTVNTRAPEFLDFNAAGCRMLVISARGASQQRGSADICGLFQEESLEFGPWVQRHSILGTLR
jgi:hypothetical protein